MEASELASRASAIRELTDGEILVATDGADRPIGWIHVASHASLEASQQAVILGLVVEESRRCAGIGAALTEAAEGWAHGRGATSIIVRSRSTRERAHRFYERIGYVEVKRSHVFAKPLV
ncbi:MAG: GNAT family N-acetyltransferase [Chloroflexota bacterium]|nr:GNAT family N-acetyltransferase [Chloroflexota bacterium]